MSQTARPSSDISVTGWTPTPVYSYIGGTSPGGPVSATISTGGVFVDQLSTVLSPAPGPQTLTVRIQKNDSGNAFVVVTLLQSTTVIASWMILPTTTASDYVFNLTPAQISSISDYSNLRVSVSVNPLAPGTYTYVNTTAAFMVELYGASGGGGNGNAGYATGGGNAGGAGGYLRYVYTGQEIGSSYQFTVGQRGTGGTTTNASGSSGTATTFDNLNVTGYVLKASGGAGGAAFGGGAGGQGGGQEINSGGIAQNGGSGGSTGPYLAGGGGGGVFDPCNPGSSGVNDSTNRNPTSNSSPGPGGVGISENGDGYGGGGGNPSGSGPVAGVWPGGGGGGGDSVHLNGADGADGTIAFTIPDLSNPVYNGSFELNDSFGDVPPGWTFSGYDAAWVIHKGCGSAPVPAYDGNYYLYMGSGGYGIMTQSVALPTGATQLAFAYQVASITPGNAAPYIRINGTNVLTLPTTTSGWEVKTINISSYAGTTITLDIYADGSGPGITSFYIDDVKIS